MANLTLAQALETIAVLLRSASQLPFQHKAETGINVTQATVTIPLSSHNAALGSALVSSQDGTNITLTLNPGDPMVGLNG